MKPLNDESKILCLPDDTADTVTITHTRSSVYSRTVEFQDIVQNAEILDSDEWDIIRSKRFRGWYELRDEGQAFELVPIHDGYRRDVVIFDYHQRCRICFADDYQGNCSREFRDLRTRGFSKQVAAQFIAQEKRQRRRYIENLWEGRIASRSIHISYLHFDEYLGIGICRYDSDYVTQAIQEVAMTIADELEKIGFIVNGRPTEVSRTRSECHKQLTKHRMNEQNTFGRKHNPY